MSTHCVPKDERGGESPRTSASIEYAAELEGIVESHYVCVRLCVFTLHLFPELVHLRKR